MDTWAIVLIVAVAALVTVGAIWLFSRKKRTETLRDNFGPEYGTTVARTGSRSEAENELSARRERVGKYEIRTLSPTEQQGYSQAWTSVQAHFVDDPHAAVSEADDLVMRVMESRGYPMSDFEQQAADISVNHPNVVRDYRAAHDIATADEAGNADTEQLRQAMTYYRSLFNDLLQSRAA